MALKSDKVGTVSEFHYSGLDTATADLNAFYRIAAKYGKSCKLRFNVSNSYKVSNNGYLSFLSISPAEIENLTKDLEKVGIKLSPYDKERGKKVVVKIENFAEPFKKDSALLNSKITENTEKFKQLLKDLCDFSEKDYKVSIMARPNPQELNELTAYVTFEEQSKAIKFFDNLKAVKNKHFIPASVMGIKVTDEAENMSNLFSIGLVKSDEKMSDEAFENEFVKALKDECRFNGIINVTVKPMRKKAEEKSSVPQPTIYLAFVTLSSEDHGRELLATYLKENNKKALKRFYKGDPFFNIFISSNFKKEMARAKEGFKRMEKDIKNFGDQLTKESIEMKGMVSRAGRPFAYPTMPGGTIPGMPGLPMPGMPGLPGMPLAGMGLPGSMPLLNRGMTGMPMPGFNPLLGPMNLDKAEILKEKESYINKDPVIVRRLIFPVLKPEVQEIVKDTNQAVFLTSMF